MADSKGWEDLWDIKGSDYEITVISVISLGGIMLVADKRAEKKINRVERIDDALILYSGDGMIKLQPKSEGIIRVIYTKKDKFSDIIKPGVICTEGFGQWTS